jgi:hypothetical protein
MAIVVGAEFVFIRLSKVYDHVGSDVLWKFLAGKLLVALPEDLVRVEV